MGKRTPLSPLTKTTLRNTMLNGKIWIGARDKRRRQKKLFMLSTLTRANAGNPHSTFNITIAIRKAERVA